MTEDRVALVMKKYGKRIPSELVYEFRTNYLKKANDECLENIMRAKMKSRIVCIFLSIFLGGIGADRFYVGDIALGVAKILLSLVVVFWPAHIIWRLLYLAGSIWKFVDIFVTYRSVGLINYERLKGRLRYKTVD